MKQRIEEKSGEKILIITADEGKVLQMRSDLTLSGEPIDMGREIMLGINFWIKGSPVVDTPENYIEVDHIPEQQETF